MRFQLDFNLGRLVPPAKRRALAKELRINHAEMTRLCEDRWTGIKRKDLQQLLFWSHRAKTQLFTVSPHTVWENFLASPTLFSKGQTPSGAPRVWDAKVDQVLGPALGKEGCQVEAMQPLRDVDAARVQMQTKNCIFVGSPKWNRDSDLALRALFDITGRKQPPFRFVVRESAIESPFISVTDKNEEVGITMGGDVRFGVGWTDPSAYPDWTGKANDAGLLIVCRQPFKTKESVTTIVLAGFTGLATYAMSRDLVSGEFSVFADELTPGQPLLRVLRARYTKVGASDESRELLAKGYRWFGPPWAQVQWELEAPREGAETES
jgi:hypothetical protein